MPIPEAATLLEVYFIFPYVLGIAAILSLYLIIISFSIGCFYGQKETLKEVWDFGVEESKRRHRKTFIKWQNKID
jgi:hypothetical protein